MRARSPARRRPLPIRFGEGHNAIFCGPIVQDANTGFSVPTRFAVKLREGVYVDKRIWRGGFDFPRWYTWLVYLAPLAGAFLSMRGSV